MHFNYIVIKISLQFGGHFDYPLLTFLYFLYIFRTYGWSYTQLKLGNWRADIYLLLRKSNKQ